MKKLISALIITSFLLGLVGCSANGGEKVETQTTEAPDGTVYQSWVTDSMEKVTGDTKAPKKASSEMTVYSAKQEKQSFHIAIRTNKDVEGLKVVVDEGNRDDITIELFKEYLIPTGSKLYPDPIVPITDTFEVSADTTESVLVRFSTASTESGEHTYKLSLVDSKGNKVGTYTVKLIVWDFALPETFSTATASGIYSDSIVKKEKIPQRLYDKYYKLYYDTILDYGISAYYLPYDILDSRADEYMSDPRVKSFLIPEHTSDETLVAYYNKLKSNHEWLEKAYVLPLDEPLSVEHIDELISRCERYNRLTPEIKICTPFFTNITYDELRDQIDMLDTVIDIWCPKSVCWQDKWLDDPLGKGYFGDRMAEQEAQGDDVWWYVCWEPGYPFCNMYVNENGINHVELFWQQYLYGVDGFLYWGVNYWTYVDDPWTDMATIQGWLSDTVYGDGSLLYPGKKVDIEGPVASLRLECIRNGLEDVELLKLAESLLGREWVVEQVSKVTKDLGTHTASYDTFNSVRAEIGNAIQNALSSGK